MKKTIIIVFACLFSVGLSACSLKYYGDGGELITNLTALPTPINVRVESDNYVYWDEVPNASSYVIKINGYQESVGNTLKYSIGAIMDSKIEYDVPTQVHIYVKAKGNQILYSDSEWSEECTYTYTKFSESEDKDDNGGTYLNSGVGASVNVITAKNYSDYIRGYSVLDVEKLKNDDLFRKDTNIKGTEIKNNSTQSISDFVNNNSVTTEVAVGTNTKKRTMFANISVGLKTSASFNYASYSDKYYYSLDSYIKRYALYISNSSSDYLDMLSTTYLKDLSSLYSNQSPSEFVKFFERYGTHLITSGVFGGRLNAYYAAVTNKSTIDVAVSSELKTAIEAGISAVNNGSVNTNVSAAIRDILNTSEFETSFYASAYGGNTFTAVTIDDMNSHYSSWASSFNTSDESAVLINYPVNSLIGLWDILPNEYTDMRTNMEDAFIDYYKNAYDTFIDSFKSDVGESYLINTTLLSCALDNGYNYDKPDANANNEHYSYKYEFGKFIVKNVEKDNDSFNIVGVNDASVYFKVTYDCDNLPLQDNMTSRYVSDDTFSTGFYNMPGGAMENKQVKRGLLVAYVTYEDGSDATRIVKNDIFNGKKAGDLVLIVDGLKKACTVQLAICFELTMWAPGFLGISDDYWMNYRINQTFIFK